VTATKRPFVRFIARPPAYLQRGPPISSRSVSSETINSNVGGFMFKQVTDIQIDDVVLDRGQTFTVKEIRVHRTTQQIGFIDTEGNFHGWYVPEEYLGVKE
jgi:hypothetical protein